MLGRGPGRARVSAACRWLLAPLWWCACLRAGDMVHQRSAEARAARARRARRLGFLHVPPPGHRFIAVPAGLFANAKCMFHGLALHAQLQADNGVRSHGLRQAALLARDRVGPEVTADHLRAHVRAGRAKHRVPPCAGAAC